MSSPLIFKAWHRFHQTLALHLYPFPTIWNNKALKLTWRTKGYVQWIWYFCIVLYVGILGFGSTLFILLRLIMKGEEEFYTISAQRLTVLVMNLFAYGFTMLTATVCIFMIAKEGADCINGVIVEEKMLKKLVHIRNQKSGRLDLMGIGLNAVVIFYLWLPFLTTVMMVSQQQDSFWYVTKLALSNGIQTEHKVLVILARAIVTYVSYVEVSRLAAYYIMIGLPLLKIEIQSLSMLDTYYKRISNPHRDFSYFKLYNQMCINYATGRRMQTFGSTMCLSICFVFTVGATYKCVKLFNAVPIHIYAIWLIIDCLAIGTVSFALPKLIEVHETSRNMLFEWGHNIKVHAKSQSSNQRYVGRKVRALMPLNFGAGINECMFFAFTQSTKGTYNYAVLNYIICAILT